MTKNKKSTFQKVKEYGGGVPYKMGMGVSNAMLGIEAIKHLFGFKKGGRVGCGIAKRGFGKAMKRKR